MWMARRRLGGNCMSATPPWASDEPAWRCGISRQERPCISASTRHPASMHVALDAVQVMHPSTQATRREVWQQYKIWRCRSCCRSSRR